MSYITEAELDEYAAARGITVTGTKAHLLVKAMDFLNGMEDEWQGTRAVDGQAQAWPRKGVRLYTLDFPVDQVPQALKDAQAQLAIEADSQSLQPTLSPGAKGAVTSETVDVLSVSYAEKPGGGSSMPFFTAVRALLRPLMRAGSGGISSFSLTRI